MTYYWPVVAVDIDGNETEASETWSFSTNYDDPPEEFSPASPVDGFVSDTVAVDLSWNPTTDPEGGAVTYIVYISTVPGELGTPVVIDLNDTTFTFTGEDDQTYYWTIVAVDENGNEQQASETLSFSIYVEEPPELFTLLVPDSADVIITYDVDLVWETAVEPDPGDSVLYEIYVSTDPLDLGAAVATDVEDTTYIFTGDDDSTYYWTVKAFDTQGHETYAENTWTFTIDVEDPPSIFSLLTPDSGFVADVDTVVLEWESTTDPDGDNLTYDVYVSTDPLDLGTAIETGLTDTTTTFTGDDDSTYYWTVVAVDENATERQASETWSFSMYLLQPPQEFSLASPDSGSRVVAADAELVWNAAYDPDPADTIRYDVFVSRDSGNLGAAVATGILDTSYTYTGDDDSTYYWTVTATDLDGNEVDAIETWSYYIDIEDPPLPFSLISPDSGIVIDVDTVEFVWEMTIDLDGDVFTWNVYASTDPLDLGDPIETGLADTTYVFTGDDDSTYYWSIEAEDEISAVSMADDIWTISL